jgi:cytidylate kinase
MSRAMTDPLVPGLASSFFDRAAAEAAASQAIDSNAGQISIWLAGHSPRLRIFGTMSTNVGRVVTREGVSVATRSSEFVLVRDATSSTGYYILTGFPDTY